MAVFRVRPTGYRYPVGLSSPSTANTTIDYLIVGGGGGGGGANGGSGIVIIRYSGSQGATGGTVTISGANTIHTFTGDGTFTSNAISFLIN